MKFIKVSRQKKIVNNFFEESASGIWQWQLIDIKALKREAQKNKEKKARKTRREVNE